MKHFKLSILLAFSLFSHAAIIQAAPPAPAAGNGLKAGSWTFSFYKPNGNGQIGSGFTICGGGDSWGSSGPIMLDNYSSGGFALKGSDVYIYGKLNEYKQIFILSAFGKLVGHELVTGNYQKINVQDASPNGDFGLFKLVYDGPVCAL